MMWIVLSFFVLIFLQFLIGHDHIFPFFVLITFDNIIAGHFFVTVPAVFLVLDPLLAVLAQLIKMDIIVYRRFIKPHGSAPIP